MPSHAAEGWYSLDLASSSIMLAALSERQKDYNFVKETQWGD